MSDTTTTAQRDLIEALGGPKAVAEEISRRTGRDDDPLRPQAVSMWGTRGVSWRYRPLLAAMAREKGLPVPSGFLGDEIAPRAVEPAQP